MLERQDELLADGSHSKGTVGVIIMMENIRVVHYKHIILIPQTQVHSTLYEFLLSSLSKAVRVACKYD